MNKHLLLALVFVFTLAVPGVCAVWEFGENTTFDLSATNVSIILGHDFTFTELHLFNDTIQLNGTNFTFIPQPTAIDINMTLEKFTATHVIFNVTAEVAPENQTYNASMILGGSGVGGMTNGSIFYNESLVSYNVVGGTRFALDDSETELEIGYANFLYVTFYNEQTGNALTNISYSLEIWGDTYAANYSGTGNNLSVNRLDVGEYELRYHSTTHPVRSYYVTVGANTNQSLKLYMLNESEASYTTFRVTDTAGNPVEDVRVKALRRFIATNTWQVVEMSDGDMNGEGAFYLEPYDVPYRFMIEQNGTVYKYTEPLKIIQSTLYFKNINLLGSGLLSYWQTRDIQYSLDWNNDTSCFEFTYVDSSNFLRAGRLYVERRTALVSETVCNQTVVAAAATIQCNMSAYLDKDGEYTATAWVDSNTNSSWWTLDRLSIGFVRDKAAIWGLAGSFYYVLIVLVMVMIGLWNPNVSVVMGIIGLIISVMMGLLPLGMTWVVGIIIVAILGMNFQDRV